MKQSDVDKSRLPWLKMSKPVKPFYPLDPRPEDIDITNIAWGLSMQCRFNGHLNYFYSVAQHSVIVSRIVESAHPFDNKLIFRALMHDAHEAYVGDIVTPVKRALGGVFEEIEDKIDRAICDKFDMEYDLSPVIKEADTTALITESRDLHDVAFLDERFNSVVPLDYEIVAVSQADAYKMFIDRFESLTERMDFMEWHESREREAG